MPMNNHLIKAYDFLRQHEGREFEIDNFKDYCGWSSISTVITYIYKLWNQFVIKVDVNKYRVTGISSITLDEFIALPKIPIYLKESERRPYLYDITLSFAGEDREYVSQVADTLINLGIRVFYDEYEQVDLWGKDLYTHLDDVYRKKARYCVMFISQNYKNKIWCNHERMSAQARALNENVEYILPVRFDDTEIPGLRPTTGFIKIDSKPPEEISLIIAKKLGIDTDLNETIQELRNLLPKYKITASGSYIVFENTIEDYYNEFPASLLIEMYKLGMIETMFVIPAIVPN